MSDTTDESNQDDDQQQGSGKNWRRDLEERLRLAEEKATQYETEATTLKRTNALKEAGLDLSVDEDGKATNPLHKFFAEKYDGKLDAQEIKTQATATGIMNAQVPQDPAIQNAASQHAFMDRASYGAQPAPSPGTQEAMAAELSTAKRKGLAGEAEFNAVLAKYGMIQTKG